MTAKLPEAGSYSPAEDNICETPIPFEIILKYRSSPPAISTLPLPSNVAVWSIRGSTTFPEDEKV